MLAINTTLFPNPNHALNILGEGLVECLEKKQGKIDWAKSIAMGHKLAL